MITWLVGKFFGNAGDIFASTLVSVYLLMVLVLLFYFYCYSINNVIWNINKKELIFRQFDRTYVSNSGLEEWFFAGIAFCLCHILICIPILNFFIVFSEDDPPGMNAKNEPKILLSLIQKYFNADYLSVFMPVVVLGIIIYFT